MPNIDSHAPGSFCWFELGTTDQNGAKAFYHALFGWVGEDSPMGPDEVYTMLRLDGRDAAALYTLRKDMQQMGVSPFWMPYISVKSADETAAAIQQHGGSLQTQPFDVMTFGRMAVVADPTGAAFSIWEPKQHFGSGITGVAGTVCWMDLLTTDPEKGAAFYKDVFGWKYSKGPHDPHGYLHIQNGETFMGGIPTTPETSGKLPPHWLLYFQVVNTDQATRKAETLGAKVHMPPTEVPGAGRFSILADPQGAVFAVWQSSR